ncbi:hypothetical protein M569_10224, partial [Genlisea aurea]
VPGLFYFGDSLLDVGNNNNLDTTAKANYPPYGIDFPLGPTGRFANGANLADYIAALVGFPLGIAPFVNATNADIVNGVNYASGGGGILDNSGSNLGKVYSLDDQLDNHDSIISRLNNLVGIENTTELLSESLYVSYIGSNDYINNYFIPNNTALRAAISPQTFATFVTTTYYFQLLRLYDCGARKVAVFGLGLIGCIPRELYLYPPTAGEACDDNINQAVEYFNTGVQSVVAALNILPGANFTYINSFAISEAPVPAGVNATAPCCVVSTSDGQCVEGSTPCTVRDAHIFYDDFHPVSIFAQAIAGAAYSGPSPSIASPYSISQLI